MPDVSGKARRPGEQNEESKGVNPEMRYRGQERGSGDRSGNCGLLFSVRWEPLRGSEQSEMIQSTF